MRLGVFLWCLFGLATPLFAQTATVISMNPKASATANGQPIKIGATLAMQDNIDFTVKDAVLTVLVGKERAFVKQKGVLKNVLSNSSNMEITFGARSALLTKEALRDFLDTDVVGDDAPLYIAVLDTLHLPLAPNYMKLHPTHGKPKAPYFQLAYQFKGQKVQKILPVGKKNDIYFDRSIFIVGEYIADYNTAKDMELQLIDRMEQTKSICKTRLRFLDNEEMKDEMGAVLAHLRQTQPDAKRKEILVFVKSHIDTQYGKIDADNLLLWLKKHFEIPKE